MHFAGGCFFRLLVPASGKLLCRRGLLTFLLTWSLALVLPMLMGQNLFAQTIANTTANANNASDSSSYDPCPPPLVCPVVSVPAGGIPAPLQITLQSAASNGGASALAHVNTTTGSIGVQAGGLGNSEARADFTNQFYLCAQGSTCGIAAPFVSPLGGIPALLHFQLDGTITPPFLFEDASNGLYGGFLGLSFDYQEQDIGGGSAQFQFGTDYDDTLDNPPTATIIFDGTTFTPTLTFQTQPSGIVLVGINWTQPILICPFNCSPNVLIGQVSYQTNSGQSIFGTTASARIESEEAGDSLGGANFAATFTTTITSLDPNFSFFSDSGTTTLSPPSSPTPEPSSLFLLGTGLLGLGPVLRRRIKSV
jgi:PEP-CTERM motif